MPVARGTEIVQGHDDQLALQDETILIDDIGDGRQYQKWNQEDQDRSPECLHSCGRPKRCPSWHEMPLAVNVDLTSGSLQGGSI
jgi:hypothetical protein